MQIPTPGLSTRLAGQAICRDCHESQYHRQIESAPRGPLATWKPHNSEDRTMPRKQVRVSEHDRRKPQQEEKTHVDHYVREQEISARSPVSAQELGSMDEQINEKVDAGWKQRGMKLLTQADRKRLPKLYSTEKTPVEDHVLQVRLPPTGPGMPWNLTARTHSLAMSRDLKTSGDTSRSESSRT